MQSETRFVAVPGSMRKLIPGSTVAGDVPSDTEIRVTVTLRRQRALPLDVTRDTSGRKQFLTREQINSDYGPQTEDIKKIEQFAKEYGLTCTLSDRDTTSISLMGSAEKIQHAFNTELKNYDSPRGQYRGREGVVSIPQSLSEIVTGVFGLDNRPVASPHLVSVAPTMQSYTPVQIAQLYGFPNNVTGAGQKIGIIELGGGFRGSELSTYFSAIGVASPAAVSAVSFPGGGTNSPGTDPFDPQNSDVEVMLDIQVIAAIATGAQVFVYFGEDASDQSFLNTLQAAVGDPVNNLNVISISWGGPEAAGQGNPNAVQTEQFQTQFNQTLNTAQQQGITVCIASGDDGSACYPYNDPQNPWDGQAHVSYPASDPLALGCGGTRIYVQGRQITQELVWHPGMNQGTGGGVSRFFSLPSYQNNAGVPNAANPAGPVMRGVPDVAGDAAQESGYQILCDGQWFPDPTNPQIPPIGGTSAVAPLWSAFIALSNEGRQNAGKGPLGFVNADLYSLPASSGAFNDVRSGTNGDYSAGSGWDPCTGLGSPSGQNLYSALLALP